MPDLDILRDGVARGLFELRVLITYRHPTRAALSNMRRDFYASVEDAARSAVLGLSYIEPSTICLPSPSMPFHRLFTPFTAFHQVLGLSYIASGVRRLPCSSRMVVSLDALAAAAAPGVDSGGASAGGATASFAADLAAFLDLDASSTAVLADRVGRIRWSSSHASLMSAVALQALRQHCSRLLAVPGTASNGTLEAWSAEDDDVCKHRVSAALDGYFAVREHLWRDMLCCNMS